MWLARRGPDPSSMSLRQAHSYGCPFGSPLGNLKLQQPQLPRSGPNGQPPESSQLGKTCSCGTVPVGLLLSNNRELLAAHTKVAGVSAHSELFTECEVFSRNLAIELDFRVGQCRGSGDENDVRTERQQHHNEQ